MSTTIQFVTDEKGERTAVVIPLDDYQQLLEDIQDLADIVDRRSEDPIPHSEFLAQLRQDGRLRD
jgi:hypothetical protein